MCPWDNFREFHQIAQKLKPTFCTLLLFEAKAYTIPPKNLCCISTYNLCLVGNPNPYFVNTKNREITFQKYLGQFSLHFQWKVKQLFFIFLVKLRLGSRRGRGRPPSRDIRFNSVQFLFPCICMQMHTCFCYLSGLDYHHFLLLLINQESCHQ